VPRESDGTIKDFFETVATGSGRDRLGWPGEDGTIGDSPQRHKGHKDSHKGWKRSTTEREIVKKRERVRKIGTDEKIFKNLILMIYEIDLS
jgi:hypothetical protein